MKKKKIYKRHTRCDQDELMSELNGFIMIRLIHELL